MNTSLDTNVLDFLNAVVDNANRLPDDTISAVLGHGFCETSNGQVAASIAGFLSDAITIRAAAIASQMIALSTGPEPTGTPSDLLHAHLLRRTRDNADRGGALGRLTHTGYGASDGAASTLAGIVNAMLDTVDPLAEVARILDEFGEAVLRHEDAAVIRAMLGLY